MERTNNTRRITFPQNKLKLFGLVLILIALSFSFKGLVANPTISNHDHKLYQTYLSGNMGSWVKIIDELNRYNEQKPLNETLFSIVQAQYGYIGYLIGAGKNREAREFLKVAETNVDKLLQKQPQNADALAIKASLIAYHIALSPYKAPVLGPRSVSMINEAYKLKGNSPQTLIEKGNVLHYAPRLFGGNPEEAVNYYIKAIIAFENQNNGVGPQSWLYLNTLAQLALAYEKSNQPQRAQKTYREILSIAPDFKWVKDELYPTFVSKGIK